jgi:4'-phosphopantetheinyl transferase EntD
MIASILPENVACAEQIGVLSGILLKEEVHTVARAVAKRKLEFSAGRTCSRTALTKLGFPAQPIGSGAGREPLWPEGIVGSITHCDGYCAAAVARAEQIVSIGIDAEPNKILPREVLREIASRDELTALSHLPQNPISFDRLLFSAKESIYKASYPLTHKWLGFEDAEVVIDPHHCTLLITISPSCASSLFLSDMCFRGRYLAMNGIIMTAVLVEPR